MFNLQEAIGYILDECAQDGEHWGLPVYEIGGTEYAIADCEDSADQAVKEYIKETIWAFSADFLSYHLVSGKLTAEQIDKLRGDSCESCNEALLAMVDDIDKLVEDAINQDGRGHFLNPYDGQEHECGNYYIYRIN